MKLKIIIILPYLSIFIGSCIGQQVPLSITESKQLYEKQKKISEGYANSAAWARKRAIEKKSLRSLSVSDTIWIIERIAEIGAPVISTYLWSDKRDTIIKYNGSSEFNSSKVSYHTFNDPLKVLTEKFDTATIQAHKDKSYIGAPYVFITRITKNQIVTYGFSDITPFDYFK